MGVLSLVQCGGPFCPGSPAAESEFFLISLISLNLDRKMRKAWFWPLIAKSNSCFHRQFAGLQPLWRRGTTVVFSIPASGMVGT